MLILILGTGWLYALAIGPLRHTLAKQQKFSLGCAILFYTGLALGYLTVGSPLDQLGEDFLFSAHMVQHMLLMYIIPPLLILGVPAWLWDKLLSNPIFYIIWKNLTHPVVAGLAITFLYTAWHIPNLYEAALFSKTMHVLEHWCMFLPALWVWWGLISPSKRVPPIAYGLRILYVFLLMVGQLPVFAFLTLSEQVLYPTYEFAPQIIALTPLQDQILGGVIMKVTNMAISLSLLCLAFYQWYLHDMNATESEHALTPEIP